MLSAPPFSMAPSSGICIKEIYLGKLENTVSSEQELHCNRYGRMLLAVFKMR
jgi:hypothetical protein